MLGFKKKRFVVWFATYDLTSVDCLNVVAVKRLVGTERPRPFCLWNFHDGWSVCVHPNCQGFEFVLTALALAFEIGEKIEKMYEQAVDKCTADTNTYIVWFFSLLLC